MILILQHNSLEKKIIHKTHAGGILKYFWLFSKLHFLMPIVNNETLELCLVKTASLDQILQNFSGFLKSVYLRCKYNIGVRNSFDFNSFLSISDDVSFVAVH